LNAINVLSFARRNYAQMTLHLGQVVASTTVLLNQIVSRPETLVSIWTRARRWESFVLAPASSCCLKHHLISSSASTMVRMSDMVNR